MAAAQPFALDGKVALVTGASRGLGFEISRALGQAGATVFVNGSDPGRAEAAASRLRDEGVDAQAVPFDVADEAAAAAAVDGLATKAGRLDILVNNVGVRLRAPLEGISSDAFRHLLDVDLVSAFALTKLAAAKMKAGGYGRIIMISSTQGLLGRRGDAAYITAKGGMNAMTRALACEYGPDAITCNAIAPGGFATESNVEIMATPASQAAVKIRSPMQRYGQPHEIGGAAVFLASPAASYVSGTVLVVDGGWSAAF